MGRDGARADEAFDRSGSAFRLLERGRRFRERRAVFN
jgi:hypothetical protein